MMQIKHEIPGTTYLTEAPVSVTTDGGPWATHNMPCPVCHTARAMMNLDGWIFQPCDECSEAGWELKLKSQAWPKRLLNRDLK